MTPYVLKISMHRIFSNFLLVATVTLLQFFPANSIPLKWAKDTPTFRQENDGSFTAIYNIMEGHYSEIEFQRRRLSELTQSELRTLILDKHNELRAKTANGLAPCRCGASCGSGHNGAGYHPGATNMNALFWDPALEKVAQQYASQCIFVHNTQRTTESFDYSYLASWAQTKEKYIGENLYISSTGQKVWNNIYGTTDYGIAGGLQRWWDESIDLQLTEVSSCGDDIGHYTQYIRADSRFVGCGISICPFGIRTRTETQTWANLNIVCNYAGGQYGDIPYDIAENQDQVASKCEADRIAHFGHDGLCGGPQAKAWFENQQESYDKTSFPTATWICDDGTGRDVCGSAQSNTQIPSQYPTTSTTTARPTNNPITPQPTTNPVLPTLHPSHSPSKLITPEPTKHIITARPTSSTNAPTTRSPTKVYTQEPTSAPLTPTTDQPTQSPIEDGDDCDPSDCIFTTNIQWKSDRKRYKGLSDAIWQTERDVLELENDETWDGKWSYSWGAQYRREESTGTYALYIWNNIDIEWEQMQCYKRDYYTEYMRSSAFGEKMKYGIGELMANRGQVTDVTVSVTCTSVENEAFGIIEDDGNIQIPFSRLNLHTYDFTDWFFATFCVSLGFFMCFACGYCMHRKRVRNGLQHGAYDECETYEMDTLEDDGGLARAARTRDVYHRPHSRDDSGEDVQIGVSLDKKHRVLSTEDWD